MPDLLRLAPGVAVATTGPRGTQTQVRIRGAEASHTLVFLDGIRFNDPAAGNEARFELLTADALSRLEIVRGPQSALWGSEALGGVIAAETADPFRGSGFEGARRIWQPRQRPPLRPLCGADGRCRHRGLGGLAAKRRHRFLRRPAASATASTIAPRA